MAVLLVTLAAGLLVAAESQASDAATPRGFLSNYLLSDAAASKNSLGDYNQFITPNTNHMKLGQGPDALYGTANMGDRSSMTKVFDREEEKAAQNMHASNNNTFSLYTIGVGLLAFATILQGFLLVRMRGLLQPAASSPGSDITMEMIEADSQSKQKGRHSIAADMPAGIGGPLGFDPLDISEGIAKENLREAEVNYGRVAMLAASEVEKFTGNMATVAAAAAVALVPTTAFAEVTFVEEAEGIFLGLFPYAAIVTIIFGGLIAKLGPALEKAQRLRRTLQLEYSAQKRFLKNTGDIRA